MKPLLEKNSERLGIPSSKLSKVLRTDNLDIVMKKEALNEKRLHTGSDKLCTVHDLKK